MSTSQTTTPPESLGSPLGCALADALALVEFGPCRDAVRPQDWMNVAAPMCAHCQGSEDVNFAAARIIAAELKERLSNIASELDLLRPEWVAAQSEGFRAVMESVRRQTNLSHNT